MSLRTTFQRLLPVSALGLSIHAMSATSVLAAPDGEQTSEPICDFTSADSEDPALMDWDHRAVDVVDRSTFLCTDLLCYQPECNSLYKSRSIFCVSAMSRYCGDRGLNMGLSQEVGASTIALACSAASIRTTFSLAELSARHSGCNDLARSQEPACMAAVHRACQARGYGGGMSQEIPPGSLDVACFQPAWYGDISIQELHLRHDGCTLDDSQSAACVAAAHRACAARGFDAGLAQEVGADAFGVACLTGVTWYSPPVIE